MSRPSHAILCNGAKTRGRPPSSCDIVRLEYRPGQDIPQNVRIGLPDFVRDVYHLPPRILDLMEIAAYVYCADRLVPRGSHDALEYHSWGRDLLFHIRVRDHEFWSTESASGLLGELLAFLAGDTRTEFRFQPGHVTPPTSLFDRQECMVPANSEVALFSGGVDSLTGALHQLDSCNAPISLVSHRSGQPATTHTQTQLTRALQEQWPGRVSHLSFRCGLTGRRAPEETQRSRFLLYAATAFAVAHAMGRDRFHVYENGITSLNLPKRQDLMNARASRTTHPRTIKLLSELLTEVHGSPFLVETPFFWMTKTEVAERLSELGGAGMLSSSVSCSKTFKASEGRLQCGGCSQCIDRRFAVFSAGLEDHDEAGLYDVDFVTGSVADAEVRAGVIDYLRQACSFESSTLDGFYADRVADLSLLGDALPGSEEDTVGAVWGLTRRHGQQVLRGLGRMREVADDVRGPASHSLVLRIIEGREYLTGPREQASMPGVAAKRMFISYAHKDEKLRLRLDEHLSPLRRQGLVSDWHDRRIGFGTGWGTEIDAHLETADIILLLVSASFIDSDYCYSVEMNRALARHDAHEAVVIPVMLRPCDWHGMPFAGIQGLPTDFVPVTDRRWRSLDEPLSQVARAIREKVLEMRGMGSTPSSVGRRA